MSRLDSAKALSSLDLNGGDRVFTVTSSGGCGILATDEGERLGLRVDPLPPEAVAELEFRTGKPVVTSNQATIWASLRALGCTAPIEGFGKLLEGSTVRAAV